MYQVILEKLIADQIVKKFLAFYGIRESTAVFTRARNCIVSLRQVRPVHTHPQTGFCAQFNSFIHLRLFLEAHVDVWKYPEAFLKGTELKKVEMEIELKWWLCKYMSTTYLEFTVL